MRTKFDIYIFITWVLLNEINVIFLFEFRLVFLDMHTLAYFGHPV